MISLFLSKRGTTYEQMLSQNGDIILEHCISATVKMERNAIWYLTIEVPESELLGYTVTDESIFKVDLNFIKGQLFRMIYPKYNRTKRTYTFYASHIFFDAQYECMWGVEPVWPECWDNKNPPQSWGNCLTKINDLLGAYKNGGIELPYQVIGTPPSEFCGLPEPNRPFYIRSYIDNTFGIDVPGATLNKSTATKLHRSNRSKAQRFYLLDKGDGYYNIVYQFGNRVLNARGGQAVSGSEIMIYNLPDESTTDNEKWTFKYYLEKDSYAILTKMNTNYAIDIASGTMANGTKIQLYQNSEESDTLKNRLFKFTYCDMFQDLKWEGKNLIECLFGTDDNSMVNAFPFVAEKHMTAMFNNYTCYFGESEDYPEELKPKQIYLTDKEITDFIETRTMENVKTGIIPKGSGGTIIYSEDTSSGVRQPKKIVQGPYWNSYEIKRVEEVTYDNITLNTDDPNAKDAFTDRGAYNSALKNAALMDLKKKKYCEPDVQTETKIVDLFKDSNPVMGNAKINDELIYISDDGTRRQKFYFESLTYDLLTGRITNADLVEEMEVE